MCPDRQRKEVEDGRREVGLAKPIIPLLFHLGRMGSPNANEHVRICMGCIKLGSISPNAIGSDLHRLRLARRKPVPVTIIGGFGSTSPLWIARYAKALALCLLEGVTTLPGSMPTLVPLPETGPIQ